MLTQDAHLPSDLIQSLASGRILPIVGWGYPDLASLAPPVPVRAPELTSAHLLPLDNWLKTFSPSLTPLYQCVAELPVKYIVAITVDRNLGRILQSTDPHWTILHSEQEEEPQHRRILIPLGGLQDDPNSLMVTERQYLSVDHSILWARALGQATQMPLLILGCDLKNGILLNLLAQLRPRPPFELAGWVLSRSISQSDQIAWQEEGFVTIKAHPAVFLRELAMIPRAHGLLSSSKPDRPAGNPYKRLDYFDRIDTDIFFGRAEETDRLIELVCSHRLVVVTGPSGAGKTSLINAGVLAWADGSSKEIGIYVRVGDDPIASLKDAMAQHTGDQYPRDLPLKAILVNARDKEKKAFIIIMDQAEELFTRVGAAFLQELISAVTDALIVTPLVARFVFCLREDYLARLAELREWIPSMLQCIFYLRELTRERALLAVKQPALQRGIHFEPGLAEQIVSELGIEVVAPPQIQIICSRLFDDCRGNVITRELYDSLGGARTLLRSFLMEEMGKLPEEINHVREVLKAMVTAEGTKEPLTLDEITRRARLAKDICYRIVILLRDRSRLLRSIQIDRNTYFELAHEYLTADICSWMTPEEIRSREAEGLLQREVHSWHRFKQLRLGLDRLKFFEANRGLTMFSVDSLVLLLLSCVRHRHPAAPWLEIVRGMQQAQHDQITYELFEYFKYKDLIQRIDAAETIALIDPGPLLRALQSQDYSTQIAALEMIGGVELKEAVPYIARILNDDKKPALRIVACGALGEISTPEAAMLLTEAADDADPAVGLAAIRSLGRLNIEFEAAAPIIRNALTSPDPQKQKAAHQAILTARHPFLVRNLLLDRSLAASSRGALWKVIVAGVPQIWNWIEKFIEQLSIEDLEHAKDIYSLKKKCLTIIARSSAKGAGDASKELKKTEAQELATDRNEQDAVAQLVHSMPAFEIARIIAEGKASIWSMAKRLGTFTKAGPMLLELMGNSNPEVRICAWATIAWQDVQIEISDRIYRAALMDADPSVRYFACYATAKNEKLSLVDAIAGLVYDTAKSVWYFSNIGKEIASMANFALDRLAPNSKVWRKPFQHLVESGMLSKDLER